MRALSPNYHKTEWESSRQKKDGSPESAELVETYQSLVYVLENMLFSMPIPQEIANKYNFLKMNRFNKVGLPFNPISNTQYPNIGKKSLRPSDARKMEEDYAERLTDIFSYFQNLLAFFIEKLNYLGEVQKSSFKSPPTPSTSKYETTLQEIKDKIVHDARSKTQELGGTQAMDISELHSIRSEPKSTQESFGKEIILDNIYKIELLQNKFFTILWEIQDTLASESHHYHQYKIQNKISQDNISLKEQNYINEISFLKKQIESLEDRIKIDESRSHKMVDEALINLKEDHLAELSRLQESHKKSLAEVNELHYATQKRLQEQLARANVNDSIERDHHQLQIKYNKLLDGILMIQNILTPIYEKNKDLHGSWASTLDIKKELGAMEEHGNKEIRMAEFVVYYSNKLANDNKWLVERLSDFGKENEELKLQLNSSSSAEYKYKTLMQDLVKEYKDSQEILTSYQDAHKNLMKELNDNVALHSRQSARQNYKSINPIYYQSKEDNTRGLEDFK